MWEIIKNGNYWEGYVKKYDKRRQVLPCVVWIKPKLDEEGNIVGYIAGCKVPDRDAMDRALAQYKSMKAQEK